MSLSVVASRAKGDRCDVRIP